MKWCNPCALVWVIIGSAYASNLWLNVHWTYCIAAVLVLIPTIAVFLHNEREDVHDAAQSIVAEIWLLFTGWKKPKQMSQSERDFNESLKQIKD